MRKLVVFNRVSADGYFATASGDLSWAVPDEAIDRGAAERLSEFDGMLFGRSTYDMFEGFWPNAVKSGPTTEDPHTAGRASKTLHALGTWINETPKYLFSNTRKELSWQSSQLLGAFDPARVRALKEREGKGLIVFGSGSIVSLLTEHRLVDEYQFVVGPLLLGAGRAMISGVSHGSKLELLEAKRYDSGNVLLRYARAEKA